MLPFLVGLLKSFEYILSCNVHLFLPERHDTDWWLVRKNSTSEKGWVPPQLLMDEISYTTYVQQKLHERIDKLPIFERAGPNEKASAPKFIEKLKPITTHDGTTVHFECKVVGVPRPQITWFRQTAICKPSQDFQMYYDEDNVATLVIREVMLEDAGMFTCVAKNAAGFATSTAELFVEGLSDHTDELTVSISMSRRTSRESSMADILEGIPPIFSRKPKAQCVKEGANVMLECRLVAVPEPEITWYYNGKEIEPKNNLSIVTESDMHMYCTIVSIKNVEKCQEGKYTIVARNREGESTLPIVLKVRTKDKEGPDVLEPLKGQIVTEGDSTVLMTTIVGTPPPKIEWLKDGKPIKENTKSEKDGLQTLTLVHCQPSYTGIYTCRATNPIGTAETSATIVVEPLDSGAPQAPFFKDRFEELIVPQNGTIRLTASVTGHPVPEVQWLLNNRPLKYSDRVKTSYDGENIELIVFNADSELDTGIYKCLASNIAGTASHGSKVLVDVEAVFFTKKLKKTITVEEGKTVTLECETSHTVSTRWWHNDIELTGMDKKVIVQEGKIHKLVIKNPNINDSGNYQCTVKEQATESHVQILEAEPEFLRKLQDCEVKEKEQGILEVEITSESVDVSWYKDGNPVREDKDHVTFVKKGRYRKLLLRNVSVHDEGEYTCVLADQECSSDLSVIELPPEIIKKMHDQTIAKGEKAVFEIELTKGDALVQWFKNGHDLEFSDHVTLTIDGKRQLLTVHEATLDDDAEYTCIVGDQESTAKLTVEEPVVKFIRRLPDITLVTKNSDASFTVELSQDVSVKWCKNKEEVTPSKKYTIINEKCIKTLVVHDSKEDDADEYECIVFNVKTSSQLKVETIKMPPTIIVDDSTYKVKEGDDVTFSVKFSATPKPEVEWTVNKKILKKSQQHSYKVEEDSASLTIKKVKEVDAGDYTIKLKNECGEAETTLKLIIMSKF